MAARASRVKGSSSIMRIRGFDRKALEPGDIIQAARANQLKLLGEIAVAVQEKQNFFGILFSVESCDDTTA
jgi:hypothetical protein